jgi:hypothetical protein
MIVVEPLSGFVVETSELVVGITYELISTSELVIGVPQGCRHPDKGLNLLGTKKPFTFPCGMMNGY